ncbi:lipopolysaccharide biosynthesis protein [Cohnella thailandensis]|uniref:Lipopolysaccharide biosynthesis protein n=1 Tax=Cohnella thailandensis TaxID=557557 RepID=A0A841T3G5_9BACL|nr:lipopolysaccharide biosynthesis protein [Cohnella thailandensis]MBB6638162.1 lipopolysaccharide biosynthesis protein [Cohnella thailandensis]MBP1971913.1 O-antigen/teichoic acid export membrane protein [Cohnella thailandensis]
MKIDRLVENIKIYFFGTFSTKLIQFLFIPLYTKYIDSFELGYFNLILSVVWFAVPLLYQTIWEGILRFVIEKSENEERIFTSTNLYCFGLSILYGLVFLLISLLMEINYGFSIFLMALTQMGVSYWQFSARALKNSKAYSFGLVANTVITVALNFILIMIFKLGLPALFISNIAGSLAMIIVMEMKLRLFANFRISKFDISLLKQLIKYSFPLSINTISWWLINSGGSIIIVNQIGIEENGIYSISSRFGMIMTLITSVVNMAWQEESFRIHGEKGADNYFNRVFDFLVRSVFSGIAVLIPVTFIFYRWFVYGEYSTGLLLTPIIYLSTAFSTFSSHLGSGFLARKESNVIFYSTLVAGIISVGGAAVLAPILGLMGVVVSSLIGTVCMFLIRALMLKKRMVLELKYINTIGLSLFCICVMFVCSLNSVSVIYQMIILIIVVAVLFFANRDIIFVFQSRINQKLKGNR